MPRWNAILDVAGDLFCLVMMKIAKSFEATVYVFCVCVHMHMLYTQLCMGMCPRVRSSRCKWITSFTRLQCSRITLCWQGFSSLLRCSMCSCRCPSDPAERLSQLPHHDLAKRVGWWWQWRGRGGVFSLQQALFSPHSPGRHTPAGTHLIMHPVWRRGQNGTKKKKHCVTGCVLWEVIS